VIFQVQMTVRVPAHITPAEFESLKAAEKRRALALQRSGKWRHLWRVAGQYSNVSIFEVVSNQELHDILGSLPLFPFMEIRVAALCRHPSSIHKDDR
jgi:muconolactone D-isomerase